MKTIISLAVAVVSSWIRDRVFYGILIVSALIVLCSLFLNEMIVGDKSKIVNDLGLTVILFLGVFMTLFTISNPTQDRSLYMILAKPIPRVYWILGNYLGNLLILFINTVVLTGLIYVLVRMSGGHWQSGVGAAIYLIYLELALMAAVCIFFSVVIQSPTLSKLCSLCIFLMGHISEDVKIIMAAGKNTHLASLFKGFYYTFPNLKAFDIKTEAVHHLTINAHHVLYASVYGIAYSVLLVVISGWIFSRTDM